MRTNLVSSNIQAQAQALARRAAAGAPASKAEVALVAKSLNVSVPDLQAAMESALSKGLETLEDAGKQTEKHRAHTAGGGDTAKGRRAGLSLRARQPRQRQQLRRRPVQGERQGS